MPGISLAANGNGGTAEQLRPWRDGGIWMRRLLARESGVYKGRSLPRGSQHQRVSRASHLRRLAGVEIYPGRAAPVHDQVFALQERGLLSSQSIRAMRSGRVGRITRGERSADRWFNTAADDTGTVHVWHRGRVTVWGPSSE